MRYLIYKFRDFMFTNLFTITNLLEFTDINGVYDIHPSDMPDILEFLNYKKIYYG